MDMPVRASGSNLDMICFSNVILFQLIGDYRITGVGNSESDILYVNRCALLREQVRRTALLDYTEKCGNVVVGSRAGVRSLE
jgi:hypothetical protein